MKHIKKFNNEAQLDSYKKSNFISPYIYFDSNTKAVKFMQKYKQLEYISSTSTGNQYIDLGCKLMANTDNIQIDIKFNSHGNSNATDKQGTLLASQLETSPYPGFVLRNITDDNFNSVQFCGKWEFNSNTLFENNKYFYKNFAWSQWSKYYNTQLINTIVEESIELNNIPEAQCHQMNTHLFCALDGSNNPFRFALADLYYLKLTKGGQVIRNLIPVKKVSTNEIGLYDMENDHLYVSQGDEPFVAGPNK